jgi:hypothetical protein
MTPRKKNGARGDTQARSNFLRRRRVAQAATDVERGLKDTDRRGIPNDVPAPAVPRSRRRV